MPVVGQSEVSEVERALEELKDALSWGTIQQRATWVDGKARNLVNALEAEKN